MFKIEHNYQNLLWQYLPDLLNSGGKFIYINVTTSKQSRIAFIRYGVYLIKHKRLLLAKKVTEIIDVEFNYLSGSKNRI